MHGLLFYLILSARDNVLLPLQIRLRIFPGFCS